MDDAHAEGTWWQQAIAVHRADLDEAATTGDARLTISPDGMRLHRGPLASADTTTHAAPDGIVTLTIGGGEPDEELPDPAAAARVLAALPPDVRSQVVIVPARAWPPGRHYALTVAEHLPDPVLPVRAWQAPPGRPFFVGETHYRPARPPVVTGSAVPMPLPAATDRPGHFELVADWVLQLTGDGMIVHRRDATVRPDALTQAPDSGHARLVIAGGPVPVSVTDAVHALVGTLHRAGAGPIRVFSVVPAVEAPTAPTSPFAPPVTSGDTDVHLRKLRRVSRDGRGTRATRGGSSLDSQPVTLRSTRAPEPPKRWTTAAGYLTVATGGTRRSEPPAAGYNAGMTGFDETVPPDDDPATDENAVSGNDPAHDDPAHDEAVPALEDDPEPDEPGGDRD